MLTGQHTLLLQTDGSRQRIQGEAYHSNDLNAPLTRQQLMLERNLGRFKTDGFVTIYRHRTETRSTFTSDTVAPHHIAHEVHGT